MLLLRPHHLLCLLFYEGKGYSESFVRNMNNVNAYLNSHSKVQILLVDGSDCICSCCPKRRENGACESLQKVERLDADVLHTFWLKIGRYYDYCKLTARIQKMLDVRTMQKLCCECEWYVRGICGKGLIGRKKGLK